MIRSGAGVSVGEPLAKQPAMRGGFETNQSMAYARQFLSKQLVVSSLDCHAGALQICGKDGCFVHVGPDEAVVLCTGQRVEGAGEGSYARRAQCNRGGLFHVAPFSNVSPANALYMLHSVITYLKASPSGERALACGYWMPLHS